MYYDIVKQSHCNGIHVVHTCLQHSYRPARKYRRHDASKLVDEAKRVQSTLLEYGRSVSFS